MSTQCVFCGATTQLNTVMTVVLDDGSKPAVHICDEHAEEATVKSCRERLLARQAEIDRVLEQAKALGLQLSPAAASGSGLVLMQAAPAPAQRQPAAVAAPPVILENSGDGTVVRTGKLDRPVQSVSGAVGQYQAAAYPSHDLGSLQDKLPAGARDGLAKIETVAGMAGMPITIPTTRQDQLGLTRIRMNHSSDAQLQARFKSVAKQSIDGEMACYRNGYDQQAERMCTMCQGQGQVAVGHGKFQLCPKCGGSCVI